MKLNLQFTKLFQTLNDANWRLSISHANVWAPISFMPMRGTRELSFEI